MLPDFLIIGAQKSATTFLHMCLLEHPEVFMPAEEIPFFEDYEITQKNVSEFEELFTGAENKKTIGIKRPSYLTEPECAKKIHQLIPNAKLIIILRDPVKRMISSYFHQMKYGLIPISPLEIGLDNILDGKYRDKYPKSENIIKYGFYYKGIIEYLKFFDQEQLLLLNYDEVKKHPFNSLKKVYRFLGIKEDFEPKALHKKPQAGIYSLERLKLTAFINKLWYDYDKENQRVYPKKHNILNKIFIKSLNLLDKLVLAKLFKNNPPKLPPEIENRLKEIYKDDIILSAQSNPIMNTGL